MLTQPFTNNATNENREQFIYERGLVDLRILVTGATGRVGSRLVPRLLQRGDAIRVVVRNAEQAETWQARGAEAVNRGFTPTG